MQKGEGEGGGTERPRQRGRKGGWGRETLAGREEKPHT